MPPRQTAANVADVCPGYPIFLANHFSNARIAANSKNLRLSQFRLVIVSANKASAIFSYPVSGVVGMSPDEQMVWIAA
jgi:hypothetical protein